MLRSARSIVVVTGFAGVMNGSGCIEVNAPPPQDLQGTGFDVVDGKVTVDTSTVPVVAECAEGQTIVRTATGWSCISPPDASKIPVVDSCADGEAVVRVGDGWGCAPLDGAGVAECAEGQTIVRTATGWSCISPPDASKIPVVDSCADGEAVVRVGNGWGCAPLDGAGVVTVADGCDADEAVVATSDGWRCAPVDDIVKVQPAQCSDGELLVRRQSGWTCEPPATYEFGTGLTTVFGGVSIDFSEVASIQRILDVESDISGLNAKATTLESNDASQSESIRTLGQELEALNDDLDDLSQNQLVTSCSQDTAGGLSFDAATKELRLCDGTRFRSLGVVSELGPIVYLAPAGTVPPIVDQSGQWPSTPPVDAAQFFLGSDVGVVSISTQDPPGFPGFPGFGTIAGGGPAAATASPVGQRRLRLPESNFSIEIFVTGLDGIFAHGDALELRVLGSEVVVRELGRETRYGIRNPIDSIKPNQVVYVHTAANERQVFFNGTQLSRVTDATGWRGAYLGGDAIFTLGSRFGAGSGGVYHRVTFSNVAVTSQAVRSQCQAFLSTIPGRCDPPQP